GQTHALLRHELGDRRNLAPGDTGDVTDQTLHLGNAAFLQPACQVSHGILVTALPGLLFFTQETKGGHATCKSGSPAPAGAYASAPPLGNDDGAWRQKRQNARSVRQCFQPSPAPPVPPGPCRDRSSP